MIVSQIDLNEIADAMDIERRHVRTDYSGRGMYGRTCVGFDLDSTSDVLRLGGVLSEILDEQAYQEFVDRMATDSMGRGIIVYFPGIKSDKPGEDSDEDEEEE
jgi:NADH/NAD ratio-sensing transcriptional regulator Rex